MIRILRWIADKIRGQKEEENECEVEYLTERELRVLAVESLVGIDRSLRYLVRQSYDHEEREDGEETAIPYPTNDHPRLWIC